MARAIVCDIEGTTSSIAFVKEVLFPYATEHLPGFLKNNREDTHVQEQLNAVAMECRLNSHDLDAITAQLLVWIESDIKATPLKTLQGLVWEHGYATGAYKAHVYDDAYEALKTWHDEGIALYIYSSGSVRAQQLFFEYSRFGDLRPLFSGYFDTTTGPKQETQSYVRIAKAIGLPGEHLLFLSDVEAELDAAHEARFDTIWVIRPEDFPVDIRLLKSQHPLVSSFEQIKDQIHNH